MKEAISMSCTKAQFEALKPKLIELGCEVKDVSSNWSYCNVLVNNYGNNNNLISNTCTRDRNNHNRTFIPEFNEMGFLIACGYEPKIKEDKIYTLEDLSNGLVRLQHTQNDEDLEKLRSVLKFCFPEDSVIAAGAGTYYEICLRDKGKWNANLSNSPKLPTQSLELFYNQLVAIKKVNSKKTLIGYRLTKEEYLKPALAITNSTKDWGNAIMIYDIRIDQKVDIMKLSKAGVLELWFEPVYKSKLTFKLGDNLYCTKDFEMIEKGGIAFTKGRVYTCEVEDCLTNNSGNRDHLMSYGLDGSTEIEISNYFRIATDEEIKKETKRTIKAGEWIYITSLKNGCIGLGEVNRAYQVTNKQGLRNRFSSDKCISVLNKRGEIWQIDGDYRRATKEEVLEATKEQIFKVGEFEIIVREGMAFHNGNNITNFVLNMVKYFEQYPISFGGYGLTLEEVTFSKTGCENNQSTLSQWREVYNALTK